MKITLRNKKSIAVATVPEPEGHRKVYERGTLEWLNGWTLVFQISVTQPNAGYALGEPKSRQDGTVSLGHNDVWCLTQDGEVRVEFRVPDCFGVMESGSWGCSANGPVYINASKFHCQALMYATTRDHHALLRLGSEGLEFCSTLLGQPRLISTLLWSGSRLRGKAV